LQSFLWFEKRYSKDKESRSCFLTVDKSKIAAPINANNIRITEVDKEGNVPELKLVNLGTKKVLIIEGEELAGAKQNRTVNSTFLIGKTGVGPR
jgi:hypothetical protein